MTSEQTTITGSTVGMKDGLVVNAQGSSGNVAGASHGSTVTQSLTVGINYQFEVQARNAYDYGPYSEQLSLLCATVPLAPEDP